MEAALTFSCRSGQSLREAVTGKRSTCSDEGLWKPGEESFRLGHYKLALAGRSGAVFWKRDLQKTKLGDSRKCHAVWGTTRSVWPLELRRALGDESREAETGRPPKPTPPPRRCPENGQNARGTGVRPQQVLKQDVAGSTEEGDIPTALRRPREGKGLPAGTDVRAMATGPGRNDRG